MGQQLNVTTNRWVFPAQLVFIAFLAGLFLLPAIEISSSLPKVQPDEFLLPLIALCCFLLPGKQTLWPLRTYGLIIAGMLLFVMLSMLVNSRLGNMRDAFEMVKLLKFALVIAFTALIVPHVRIRLLLQLALIASLLFNLLHYIDFMGFNQAVVSHYGSEIQVDTFGLNSLGQPDTKRVLGVIGNPNGNAILFMFFAAFFFPAKNASWKEQCWFFLAVFGVLACQSRTAFITLLLIIPLGVWHYRYGWKQLLMLVLLIAALYSLLLLLGNLYISSLTSGKLMQSNAVRGRFEVWGMLWEMIKAKPLLGYGPFKDYFYTNNIYAENEYILYLWRYGFLGLPFYFLLLGWPAVRGWQTRMHPAGINLLLFAIVIAVSALTNTPLSEPKNMMMFALFIGIWVGTHQREQPAL